MPKEFNPVKTPLDGVLLVEANAGTGKTYSLMHVILRLLVGDKDHRPIDLNRILVVTFTKAATAEIVERLRKNLRNLQEQLNNSQNQFDDPTLQTQVQVWEQDLGRETLKERVNTVLEAIDDTSVFTIHGFCQRTLQSFSFSSGDSFESEVGDDSELRKRVLEDFLKKECSFLTPSEQVTLLSDKNLETYLAKLSICLPTKNSLIPQFWYGDSSSYSDEFKTALNRFITDVPNEFLALKRQFKILSYDDMLSRMAKEVIENKEFCKLVREQYDAVLIDEFQDTDPLQYEIFSRLFISQNGNKEGYPQCVFFVGDPKQSIYRFRNADLATYLKAKRSIPHHYVLTKNWRSVSGVVEGVNLFFSESETSFLNENLSFEPSTYSSSRLPLFRKTEDAIEPISMFEFRYTAPEHSYTNASEAREHADQFIAQDIAKLLKDDNVWVDSRKLRPSDIAILVRKREDAQDVINYLKNLGIRTLIDSGTDVFSTDEAKEILDVLYAMESPKDSVKLNRVRATKIWGEPLSSIVKDEEATMQCRMLFESLSQQFISKGISKVFQELFTNRNTTARLLPLSNGERSLTNYQHIIEELHKSNCSTISNLIYWFNKQKEKKEEDRKLRRESDADLVQIVTIHASKGLEYPVVYLAGVSKQFVASKDKCCFQTLEGKDKHLYFLPPIGLDQKPVDAKVLKKEDDDLERQECVRLAYVAMTRASKRFVLPLFFYKTGKWTKSSLKNPYCWALAGNLSENQKDLEATLQVITEKIQNLQDRLKEEAELAIKQDYQNPIIWKEDPILISSNRPVLAESTKILSKQEKEDFACDPSQRIHADWYQTSFTGLTKGQEVSFQFSASDETEIEDVEINTPYFSHPLSDETGADFGNFMHALFEKLNFKRGTPGQENVLKEYCQKKCSSYFDKDKERETSFEEKTKAVTDIVRQTLCSSLFKTEPKIQLKDIDLSHRSSELDFVISVGDQCKKIDTQQFAEFLKQKAPEYFENLSLNEKDFQGFLVGSMDLVFEFNGKFYIVDWKTNLIDLPDGTKSANPEDYTDENIQRTMKRHQYYLQALLYQVALLRMLKLHYPNQLFPTEMLGEIAYVFLRAIDEEHPGRGVCSISFSPQLIEDVDAFLSNQNRN